MTNGFYKTDHFSNALKKKFIKDAIYSSYKVLVESKYKYSSSREIDKELSVNEVIEKGLLDKTNRLDVVDRFAYNSGKIKKELCEYEITFHFDWTFLYIFVNETMFNNLIDKYKLKLNEW